MELTEEQRSSLETLRINSIMGFLRTALQKEGKEPISPEIQWAIASNLIDLLDETYARGHREGGIQALQFAMGDVLKNELL